MDIKQVTYFKFEVNELNSSGKRSSRKRISLDSDNIEVLLERLEKGENIFKVVPELKRDNFNEFSMIYGLFEERGEVVIDGKKYVSFFGYEQVGKLLIPDYQIFNRSDVQDRLDKTENQINRRTYSRLLSNFPKVNEFYHGVSSYAPLDTSEVIVLNKDQL